MSFFSILNVTRNSIFVKILSTLSYVFSADVEVEEDSGLDDLDYEDDYYYDGDYYYGGGDGDYNYTYGGYWDYDYDYDYTSTTTAAPKTTEEQPTEDGNGQTGETGVYGYYVLNSGWFCCLRFF